MPHDAVYKIFSVLFPMYAGDNASIWFQNGKNSIRVRLLTGVELVFSCSSNTDWRLESIDSFIKNQMKGECKKC